jgi:hypothetical protein
MPAQHGWERLGQAARHKQRNAGYSEILSALAKGKEICSFFCFAYIFLAENSTRG